jgi:3-deoxy-manno-octulosonate cytidylyltransferase (CMP-KDO synthetase)
MVQHVWERCGKAGTIDRAIVATDDTRIAEAAFAFGAEVSLTSQRHRSGTDRVAEVARRMSGVSHVINVQGDEPLVDPALIDRLARVLAGDSKIRMITAANPFGLDEDAANPNQVKVVLDRNGDALYFSRSLIPFQRDAGFCARRYRHHGIYGYSTKLLLEFVNWKPTPLEKTEQLEQLRALEHGVRIRVLITRHRSVGVDTPQDAASAEQLLAGK